MEDQARNSPDSPGKNIKSEAPTPVSQPAAKESGEVAANVDQFVREAIACKRLIRFQYGGYDRIAEPHDYGVQAGTVRLFCYQTGGQSRGRLPNWRLLDVAKIGALKVLDQTFPGGRGALSSKHLVWDKVFARVGPAEEDPG